MYYRFFSTLHRTGKYRVCFQYRESTVRCTVTYCCECDGCLAAELFPYGGGGQKGTVHHVQLHVVRKRSISSSEKYSKVGGARWKSYEKRHGNIFTRQRRWEENKENKAALRYPVCYWPGHAHNTQPGSHSSFKGAVLPPAGGLTL